MITIILHILFLQAFRAQTVPSQPACEIINSHLNCSTFPKELICASNGVEYPTHCDFAKDHCENPSVHIVQEGACPGVTSPQPTNDPLCEVVINAKCPHEANQICGSDGRNYHNLCLLHKVACGNPQLVVAHKGPCASSHSTHPPSSSAPSTAHTEGVTTPTVTKIETVMTQGSSTTIRTTTMDPALCQAILVVACGHTLDEVCGNDGKAYKNRCEFEKAVCRDATLREVSLDNCPILTNPPTTETTTTTTPVPTTQTTPDVTVTFSVLCRAILVAICPPEVKEVCGSDGKTYKNICRFQKAKCYYPRLTSTSGYCTVVQPPSTQQATTTLTTTTSQHVTTKGTVSSAAAQQMTTTAAPFETTLKTITATIPMASSRHVTTKVTIHSTAAKQVTTTPPLVTTRTTSMTTTAMLSSLCQVIVTLPCSGDDTTCATDGKIYTNKCEYSKAKCYRPSLNIAVSGSCAGHSLTTASPTENLSVLEVICGTLMKVKCVDDSLPVCASNNVTYDNECEYEKARCEHKNLHVVRFQPCVSK